MGNLKDNKILKFLVKLVLKLVAVIAVLFGIYMINGDSRLIEVIYDALYKYHRNKKVEDKI